MWKEKSDVQQPLITNKVNTMKYVNPQKRARIGAQGVSKFVCGEVFISHHKGDEIKLKYNNIEAYTVHV